MMGPGCPAAAGSASATEIDRTNVLFWKIKRVGGYRNEAPHGSEGIIWRRYWSSLLFIHSDLSHELTSFLEHSCYKPYLSLNLTGNGQVERYNGVVWKTVTFALKNKRLPTTQ
ncbi:hypothetical protein J6590_020554 [Homalodisca vitripennis]|nr:hypothetical protein J6590_020554 [Homalodisca vitripennis]